jgi:DNA-directed RNA polymerase specialized sigma24 family protein
MPIDDEQLAKIRKYDRTAVAAMVTELYPQLYRIAAGLSGQEDVALGTLRYLLKQSIEVMPKWKDEDAPQRYYLHHLILLLRRARKHPPQLRNDLLIDRSVDSAEYRAFLTGFRKLPFQQQEAFLLNHGEKLNARYLAVAMDCSTVAANTHLSSAEKDLKILAGSRFDFLASEMAKVYRSHHAPAEVAIPSLRDYVEKQIGRRRLLRLVKWVALLLLLAILIIAGRMVWRMVEY